jgi:hypothetical protein
MRHKTDFKVSDEIFRDTTGLNIFYSLDSVIEKNNAVIGDELVQLTTRTSTTDHMLTGG